MEGNKMTCYDLEEYRDALCDLYDEQLHRDADYNTHYARYYSECINLFDHYIESSDNYVKKFNKKRKKALYKSNIGLLRECLEYLIACGQSDECIEFINNELNELINIAFEEMERYE